MISSLKKKLIIPIIILTVVLSSICVIYANDDEYSYNIGPGDVLKFMPYTHAHSSLTQDGILTIEQSNNTSLFYDLIEVYSEDNDFALTSNGSLPLSVGTSGVKVISQASTVVQTGDLYLNTPSTSSFYFSDNPSTYRFTLGAWRINNLSVGTYDLKEVFGLTSGGIQEIHNFETDIPAGTCLVLEYANAVPEQMTLTATFFEKFNARSATHGQAINWGSGNMFVFSDIDLHDTSNQIAWEVVNPDIFRSSKNGRYVVNTFGETSFCCIINPVNNWDMDYQGNPYEANPPVHVYVEGDINNAYTFSLNQTYAKVITSSDKGLVWDEETMSWKPFVNDSVSDTIAPDDIIIDTETSYESNMSMVTQAGYGVSGININGTGDIFSRSAKNLQEAYSNHSTFISAVAQWLSIFPSEIWTILLTTALVICGLAIVKVIL